eukprot:6983965-Pyramimonas_sp.AAC.1
MSCSVSSSSSNGEKLRRYSAVPAWRGARAWAQAAISDPLRVREGRQLSELLATIYSGGH